MDFPIFREPFRDLSRLFNVDPLRRHRCQRDNHVALHPFTPFDLAAQLSRGPFLSQPTITTRYLNRTEPTAR
jgi:hypothetical protein